MNTSQGRKAVFCLLLSICLCLIAFLMAEAQKSKFSKSSQAKFFKACGDGLDENSACGTCGRIEGVSFTKGTTCGHVCVKIPDDKTDKNMSLAASAGEDGLAPVFQACGSPDVAGACAIGWSRFEGDEYYPDKHEMCGRFKNWSADRDRIFRVVVTEK